MRPDNGRMGFFSKIATPGPHIIVPGAKLVGAYTTNQFPVYLFRHDAPPVDYTELELPDITLIAKVSVVVQIGGTSLSEKVQGVYNAHYNAEDQDLPRAAERILNPWIKLILQRHSFDEYSSQVDEGKEVEEIQISKITPGQLLKALGLRQKGALIGTDDQAKDSVQNDGITILAKLANIGVDLLSINIDDLSLPDEVNEARNRSAVEKADQKAALDRETARSEVIDKEVENRVKEAEGLLRAVKALRNDPGISDEQAYRALVEIPALQKIVGDKDKFITEGGLNGLLAMLQSKK